MPRFHPADNRGWRRRGRTLALVLRRRVFGLAWLALLASPEVVSAQADAERGAGLFAMAGGCGCHTGPDGPVGAGGGVVPTPFGTFYGTNITADGETGIGKWTDEQIAAAIRDGWLPDGTAQSPAMPYYRYTGMTDADVADLIAYLRTLPAVHRENQAHEVTLPLPRLAYRGWRLLFHRQPQRVPTAAGDEVGRGRYLVDHVAICGDCHTPRTRLGSSDNSYYLAGTRDGPDGVTVPNITPARSGIHDWDAGDIVSVLTLGMLPDFDNVQGLMAEVVDGKGGGPGYKDAPASDVAAIAAYLEAVPPIEHDVRRKD